MATLLTIDASSSLCSVALERNDELLWSTEDQPRRHAQRLLPMIDDIVAQAGIAKGDLDGIAFGRGPGSFTGIRIAVSVAQGLSLGLDVPVCGVSSLATVALAAAQNDSSVKEVFALMDAHMGEVFWGRFQVEDSGLTLIGEEVVGSPELCIAAMAECSGQVAGNGLDLETFSDCNQALASLQPEARVMASLARDAWKQGQFGAADQHSPVYLRNSVAWKKLDEQPSLLKRPSAR